MTTQGAQPVGAAEPAGSALSALAGAALAGERSRAMLELLAHVDEDVSLVERGLAELEVARDAPAESCVRHILGARGKRVRPLCVALAARVAGDFNPAARELAIAVELIHAATLLHDDVIDVAAIRRGVPAARMVFGDAASLLGGNWLFVESIRHIRTANVPTTLEHALLMLRAMVEAESTQLAHRGAFRPSRATYMQVLDGKTGSLFRWSLRSGALAGGANEDTASALERFGACLGAAFQVIDDLLDFTGDAEALGKCLFADVREGKMTYPLVVAAERDPSLIGLLREAAAPRAAPQTLLAIRDLLHETGAIDASREFARGLAQEADAELAYVPPCPARDALARTAASLLLRQT